jgi:hypothetical protein
VAYSVTSIASDDSSEAEEPVDEQTMRDVAMYLDKITLQAAARADDDQDSVDSGLPAVDAETIQQVEKYLDLLHVKKPMPEEQDDQGDDSSEGSYTVDTKTLLVVDSVLDTLHIKTAAAAASSAGVVKIVDESDYDDDDDDEDDDDDDDEDDDDDDNSNISSQDVLDTQTLATVGAYIDAVSQVGVSRSLPASIMKIGDAPPVVNTMLVTDQAEITSAQHRTEINASKSVAIDERLQVSYFNQEDDDNDSDGVLRPPIQGTYDREFAVRASVARPSPIYEQMEAMALPRGAHVDPPSVMTSHNADQEDPPGPSPKGNMNDAVMRMHEAQVVVAPSYSVESLESGALIPHYGQDIEEEKKQESVDTGSELANDVGVSVGHQLSVDESEVGEIRGLLHTGRSDLIEVNERLQAISQVLHEPYYEVQDNRDGLNEALDSVAAFEPTTPSAHSRSEMSVTSELVDDAGVPIRQQLSGDASDVNEIRGSQLTGRYDMIEANSSAESAPEDEYVVLRGLLLTGRSDLIEVDERLQAVSQVLHEPYDNVKDDGDGLNEALDSVAAFEPTTPSAHSRSEMSVTSELVDDAGVPIRQLSGDASDVNEIRGSQLTGRYDMIEANASAESAPEDEDVVPELPKFTALELPNPPSMKDEDSFQSWELKGIASEETLKAAGRTRMPALDSAERFKARKLTSIMSDDSSVANSMTAAQTGEEQEKVEVSFEEGESGVEILDASLDDGGDDENVDEQVDTFEPDSQLRDQEHGVREGGVKSLDKSIDVDEQEGKLLSDSQHGDEDFVDEFLRQGSVGMSGDAIEGEISVGKGIDQQDTAKLSVFSDKCSAISASPPTMKVSEAENLDFLQQFDALFEMDTDNEAVTPDLNGDVSADNKYSSMGPSVSSPEQNLPTLSGISMYFATIDQHLPMKNAEMKRNVKTFQKLVAPVAFGVIPSVIETTQIRQAALRAEIPIDIVDGFLDLINNERSSAIGGDDASYGVDPILDSRFDDMEELNEDEAISAFLSRFGTLHKGGHFPEGNTDAIQDYIETDFGAGEAAVEIDVEYGFVNKDLAVREETDHGGDSAWWESVQKAEKKPNLTTCSSTESNGRSGHTTDNAEGAKPAQPPAHNNSSRRPRREARLVVNTAYVTTDHDDHRDHIFHRLNEMATFGKGWEGHAKWLSPTANSKFSRPQHINGVAVTENIRRFVFSKSLFKNHRPWRRLYRDRTQYHSGFKNVDVYSIYESTIVDLEPDEDEECIPWEHREVLQRFLQEKSFSFSRNWFGDLIQKRANQKIKAPVCKPKSMEMPMEIVPEPGEWTEEWYTQWKSPAKLRRGARASRSDDSSDSSSEGSSDDSSEQFADNRSGDQGSFTENGGSVTDGSRRPHTTHEGSFGSAWRPMDELGSSSDGNRDGASCVSGSGSESDEGSYSSSASSNDGSASWEEAPECGEIVNVRQKIGERVTRVHPDYTSSLRRSRWRKKYFPRGTFPY